MKTAYVTNIGLKKTNQDSMLIARIQTRLGEAAFGIVCDGMGGIQKGEVASAAVVRDFDEWLQNGFSKLIANGFSADKLFEAWEQIIQSANRKLIVAGEDYGIEIGTTIVAILILQDRYYIVNVGDSRAYEITDDGIMCLTKDHSLVMQEVEEGRLNPDQLEHDRRRHILLQCVGASGSVEPDYFVGEAFPGRVFMLCCDGFRHEITPKEFYEALRPCEQDSQKSIFRKLDELVQVNLRRGEKDNISAICILLNGE